MKKILSARNLSVVVVILLFIQIGTLFTNCAGPGGSEESLSVLGEEFSGQIIGGLIVVEASGLVQGYALDPNNASKQMRVHFVADGAEGSGVYVGNAIASRSEPGAYTGHYFSYTLPSAYRTGMSHTLYVYGHEVRAAYKLSGSPKTFAAFLPKAQSVYVSSGLGSFISTSCAGCHSWTYSNLFYSTLVSPNPFSGGTATNNKLINKISGSHGGNSPFCATKDAFPCMAIQQWWAAEF